MEKRIVYRVVDVVAETSHASSFLLEPDDMTVMNYQTGQFITLIFQDHVGKEERRSYSLSSVSGKDKYLQITVKRVANGAYSRWMLDHVGKGDRLWGLAPAGLFTLPAIVPETCCFFAAGSGIVPIYGMIRELLQHDQVRIQLIYSNSSKQETIFYDQLRSLQELHQDRFEIRFLFSDASRYQEARLSGGMVADIADAYKGNEAVRFYVCGPFEYMRMIELVLRGHGIRDEQIKREQFVIYKEEPRQLPPDTEPHKVSFDEEGVSIEVQYPQTILAAAKKAGIALPYSCESGQCGTCIANCVSGQVWMWRNEVLTDEELRAGRVLTCTGFPVGGDVVLRY